MKQIAAFARAVVPRHFLERQLRRHLACLDGLPLELELWDGRRFTLGQPVRVRMRLPRAEALRHLLYPTLDTLGAAYVEGRLEIEGDTRDIVAVAADLSRHRGGAARRAPVRRRPHKAIQDAADIRYHYDVSNEFYQTWLDPELVYSCAYFRTTGDSLAQAQRQKLDHILTKIALRPGQRLLDIGCGWGALVLHAARHYGARCVGITLSQQQCELANQRVREAGLQRQVEIRLQDYREVDGRYDRITSVGMFEHVGLARLRAYFRRIHDLLEPDGVAMNHGITTGDPGSGANPIDGGEFLDRYVFPNGELPHISLALHELSAAGLEATDVENLRRHYTLTLEHWSRNFESASARLRELAGERRYRIWRVYLAGCAHAFQSNWMALHQIVAVRSGAAPLPLTRDYMYRPGISS